MRTSSKRRPPGLGISRRATLRAVRRETRPCKPFRLVNNAGGPPPGDFRDWDRDAWIKALDANMLTPIELIRATVDAMARARLRPRRQHHVGCRQGTDRRARPEQRRTQRADGFVAGLARSVTINGLLPGAFETLRLRTTMRSHRAVRVTAL